MAVVNVEQNMEYVMKLNEDQKVVFMKALARLASADGNFDKDEQAFVREISQIYGIPSKRIDEIMQVKDDDEVVAAAAQIKDRKVALELIKEMCILSHSDDILSERETCFIGRIGEAMGIELEKIEPISRWVIDRIIWQEEAKLIFELD